MQPLRTTLDVVFQIFTYREFLAQRHRPAASMPGAPTTAEGMAVAAGGAASETAGIIIFFMGFPFQRI